MTSLHEWRRAADESLARSRARREPQRSHRAFLIVALIVLAALIVLLLNAIQNVH